MDTKPQRSLRRNIFSGTYRSEFAATYRLPPRSMSALTDSIVSELLPQEAYANGQAYDFKGIDPQRWGGLELSSRELILAVEGAYFSSGEIATKAIPASFEISAATNFDHFDGSHHIAHRITLAERGGLTEYLPLDVATRYLGRIIPAEIHRIRFGLEFFESKHYMVFGYSPVVTEYFTITAKSDTLALTISAETLPSKETLPLSRSGYLEKLSRVLRSTVGVDLESALAHGDSPI